mgnify:CR=1 FL=1|jgi:hypothetical protein
MNITVSQPATRLTITVEQNANEVTLQPVVTVYTGGGSFFGGDMYKAVYDPTLVEGDAFLMDNMNGILDGGSASSF